MIFQNFRRFTLLIPSLLLAALLFLPGCGGDDPVDPVVDPPFVPPATTAALMLSFENNYTEMLIEDFSDLLHPDFQMILLARTCQNWGWPDSTTFDKTEMIAIHDNVFSGLLGLDPNGNTVHPVDRILVDVLELQGTWAKIPEDDLYFGGYDGWWGCHQVELQFWDADNSHRFVVYQAVNFFVTEVTIEGNTGYQLLGIRGLPLFRKTDEATWGDLLALYR
jgi:hypothetical protein